MQLSVTSPTHGTLAYNEVAILEFGDFSNLNVLEGDSYTS